MRGQCIYYAALTTLHLLESAESMQRPSSKKVEAMWLLLKSDESMQMRSGSKTAEAMLLLLESAESMPGSRSTKADAFCCSPGRLSRYGGCSQTKQTQ